MNSRSPLCAGQRGNGQVYLAEDTRLGRKVAPKFLSAPAAAGENRLARFEQEARAASGLNHPNILTIHEIGEFDRTAAFAGHWREAQTLSRRAEESAGPSNTSGRVVTQSVAVTIVTG